MATNEEILAGEWRAIILNKLKDLENGQVAIQSTLANLNHNYADLTEFHDLRREVDGLKLYRAKLAGVIVGLNGFAILAGWFIQSFLTHH